MTDKTLTFGEILLRLSPPNFQRIVQTRSFEVIFGGAEANVAVSLANFGTNVEYLTRLPKNELGDACLNYLRQFGVDTKKIIRGGKRLGIYFFEKGVSVRSGKVIYDRSHSALSMATKEMFNWDSIFQGIDWFHWTGITPALSANLAEICLNALQQAKKKGIMISCDLNYRNKLWKYGKDPIEIMPQLVENCNILIGSKFNIKKMLGISLSDVENDSERSEIEKNKLIIEKVFEKFPNIEKIAITIRNSITSSHNTLMGFLHDGEKIYSSPTYDIDFIVDRVGAGDAFNAGLIYGLKEFGENLQKTIDFAIAAAALKHTIIGDFNIVNKNEVEKVLEGNSSGIISR
ncbi:MAG: sugar kinase [Promethearchaeota archaeon]|nr:MAG: sugar kinase [Candidatus Lokiarchaeota archaeon]